MASASGHPVEIPAKIYPTDLMINHAAALSNRVQLLISNERKHINRGRRDLLALAYWTLLFEHHQGILILLRNHCPAPAFSLLRVFEEAYLNLFVATFGEENQVERLSKGEFRPRFESIGKQIDKKIGTMQPMFAPWFKDRIDILHGLTHGGLEQLNRQVKMQESGEMDFVSSYSDDEIRDLVQQTMPTIFLAAIFITEFLDYSSEYQTASDMFAEYVNFQKDVVAKQAELDELRPKSST